MPRNIEVIGDPENLNKKEKLEVLTKVLKAISESPEEAVILLTITMSALTHISKYHVDMKLPKKEREEKAAAVAKAMAEDSAKYMSETFKSMSPGEALGLLGNIVGPENVEKLVTEDADLPALYAKLREREFERERKRDVERPLTEEEQAHLEATLKSTRKLPSC